MEQIFAMLSPWIAVGAFLVIFLVTGIKIVPQNEALVVERFGKYRATLSAGLNFIVPVIDRVAYKRTLKEQAIDVPQQEAICRDNIALTVDGVLYLKVLDPQKSCYGIDEYRFAVTQLAQTTMRSEIGKLDLDRTFEERDALNVNIVNAINAAAQPWGVQVLRYEIRDIKPPGSVLNAMEAQVRAEREKRAAILESEGDRESAINRAEGEKRAKILEAEALRQEQILQADGEAKAIMAVAKAQAEALKVVGAQASTDEGGKAVQFELATKAIGAKEAIARESSVVLLPESGNDIASMVTQAMAVAQRVGALPAAETKAG